MLDLANTMLDVLLLPGRLLLQHFPEIGAVVVSVFHLDPEVDALTLTAIVSVASWLALALSAAILGIVFRNGTRVAGALIRTFGFRLKEGLRGLRTFVICRLRGLAVAPRRAERGNAAVPDITLTAVDEAVLKAAEALGPGFTVSAPELAERISLRPAQIQRSLDKLRRSRMIDPVIGSTDGFDNYRLTDSGSFVVSMWQRGEPQQRRSRPGRR